MAGARWSTPSDLTDATEQLAVTAIIAAAEHEGRLDDLEDELFRFGRIVASQPELRIALTNPFVPADAEARPGNGPADGQGGTGNGPASGGGSDEPARAQP